jgi:hypothetical protein
VSHVPRVGLFFTGLVDAMPPNVGFASIRLFEAAGCRVNCGDTAAAALPPQVPLAFKKIDNIVAPSASNDETKTVYRLQLERQFSIFDEIMSAAKERLKQFDVSGGTDAPKNIMKSIRKHRTRRSPWCSVFRRKPWRRCRRPRRGSPIKWMRQSRTFAGRNQIQR